VCFVTVFLHELGLCIATRQVNTPPPCRIRSADLAYPPRLLNNPRLTIWMLLVIMQVGGAVHGILLGPMGGLTYVGRDKSPARDLYVAVCGPLTHTLQARP